MASTVRAPEMPLTPPSQGNVTFDTHPAAANFALGPLPPGQSASQPLDSGPLPILQLSIPTDGSPEMQYQQLMEIAQRLQGMALSLHPSFTPVAPKAPLRPALASQSFPSVPPPRPPPQLLTASVMGAQLPPLAYAQHPAQHPPLAPGDQSLGLVGVQYPLGPPLGTVLV